MKGLFILGITVYGVALITYIYWGIREWNYNKKKGFSPKSDEIDGVIKEMSEREKAKKELINLRFNKTS